MSDPNTSDFPPPELPPGSIPTPGAGSIGWEPPALEHLARLFPQYEVMRLIGRGGMGAVYLARQTSLDRLVAIKLLPLEVSACGDFAERFTREARSMAKLSHPHIIAVHDFGHTAEGHLFFVMEFVNGSTLHELIQAAVLGPADMLGLAAQVCDALGYAHEKGVVHRDIKPANVLVDTDGHVKIADFGLARLNNAGPDLYRTTLTGLVMGTPDYMAPEQKRAMNVDHRADIYSFGVMLYEMLTREVPQGSFVPASTRARVDQRVDVIIKKAMRTAPEDRFQSAVEIKAEIERIRTRGMAAAPAAAPAHVPRAAVAHTPQPQPPAAKSKKPLIIGLGTVAAALAAIIFWPKGEPKLTEAERAAANKPANANTPAPQPPKPAPTPAPAIAKAEPPQPAEPAPPTPQPAPAMAAVSPEDAGTFAGWTGPDGTPAQATWKFDAGVATTAQKTALWSPDSHGDFELELEWKVGPRGDGGAHYRVPDTNEHDGLEMQLCDKASARGFWPGGLFGILTSRGDHAKPVGEWNTAKLVVKGTRVEHWINDKEACSYDTTSALFARQLAAKNLQDKPGVRARTGRIVLQAESGEVSYRNLRIRPLDDAPATEPAPMPEGVITFNGHRYRFIAQSGSWGAARDAAKNLGGHLVAINSREENDWIKSTFRQALAGKETLWIGATSSNSEGQWMWANGDAIEFMDWDARAQLGARGHGSLVGREGGWRHMHNGAPNPDSRGFIIEWSDAPKTPAEPAKPPPPPASPEVVKWLAEQEAIFSTQWKNEAVAAFDATVAKLRDTYAAAVEKGIADATRGAKLDEALAWRNEKARIATQQPHEAGDAATDPAALKTLRAWWRAHYAKADSDRFNRAKLVHARFDALLEKGQTGYTQRQRLDDALLLKMKRDEIRAEWLIPPVNFSKPSAPARPMGEILAPPKPANAGSGAITGREAVELFASWSGDYYFFDADGRDCRLLAYKRIEDLPKGRLEPYFIRVGNRKNNGTPITDADFATLGPMRKLARFVHSAGEATGTGLAFLAGAPELADFDISGPSVTDAAIQPLLGLRKITALSITGNQTPLDWSGFGEFASLGTLSSFAADRADNITPETFARMRKLQRLHLQHSRLTEAQAAAIAALPALENLTLSGLDGAGAAGLRHLEKSISLTELNLIGSEGIEPHLPAITRARKLHTLHLDGHAAESLTAAAGASGLRSIILAGAAGSQGTTDAGIKAIAVAFPKLETLAFVDFAERAVTAEGIRELATIPKFKSLTWGKKALSVEQAAAIATLPALESLIIGDSGITEAQLAEIAKSKSITQLGVAHQKLSPAAVEVLKTMRGLRELFVYNCNLSTDDIAALRKALPRCTVRDG